ncbi:MAG: polyhydroxyalkanoic acid system family protein [Myxococcota bacterium]|jgi:hypothetical protein
MADITLHRTHAYGAADARARLERMLKDFQAAKPDYVQQVTWAGNGATASGKYFKGQFTVTETAVDAEIELIGFAAKLARGIVRERLEQALATDFPV